MKMNMMRESGNLKKSQYSSRIYVAPTTTSNKSSTKVNFNKRGNSQDVTRENQLNNNNGDNDGISSLISQVIRNQRPSTSQNVNVNNINNASQNSAQMNSPRPNTERMMYSLSPTRTQSKNSIKLLPPKAKHNMHKKTLVLDLDETLVHSGFKPFNTNSDIILKIELDNKIHDIHVLVRPGVEEFLDKMSKHYELIVFTASLSKYADPLVDRLDGKRHCFFRLFRQHCTEINKSYVKDLRKLDRDMKDVIILDNSPVSFALNVENGFPIKNWYDDRKDRELYNITHILEFLAYVPDCRDFLKIMVEKNEINFPKTMNIINSYNQSKSTVNSSQIIQDMNAPLTPNISNNSNKNNNIKEQLYKQTQSMTPKSQQRALNISDQNLQNLQKDNVRYSSNLTSQVEKTRVPSSQNNNNLKNFNNFNRELIPNSTSVKNSNSINPSAINNKKELDKQNINIKIINNHINHFIISGQEGSNTSTNNPNSSNNNNTENTKKNKNINTFRSSNQTIQDKYPNHPINDNYLKRDNSSINMQPILNRTGSNLSQVDLTKTHTNINRFNMKNLNNSQISEIKSPILKNNSVINTNHRSTTNNQTQSIITNNKYSSLIDTNKNNVRPSSAIAVKGRHSREVSTSSLKHENLNIYQYNPLTRTPSQGSLNKNYPRHNNKITRNYLGNLDLPKNIIMNQGNKTMRSTTSERLRINYSNNPLSSMNNINQIKVASRYDVDDLINKRGYSLSSRAADSKLQSYRYENKNYQSPSNKFSAQGIYRSNSNINKLK